MATLANRAELPEATLMQLKRAKLKFGNYRSCGTAPLAPAGQIAGRVGLFGRLGMTDRARGQLAEVG